MIDANSQFFAILTNVGMAKQANADALGIPWLITQMGVGDANPNGLADPPNPVPSATQTQLLNEWRRKPLNQLKIDPNNSAVIIAEQVIPADEGGKWIREMGLYDADGDLVAVANCAPSFKPLLSQGSGRTQIVRMNFIVTSTGNIQLKIDPSVVLATREYVDAKILEELYKLDNKQSVRVATTANIALTGLQSIDGVALVVGDRVLVKNQNAAKDNGIWVAAAAGWSRAADADSNTEVTSALLVSVEQGTTLADTRWQLITDGAIVLGTTALTFQNITQGFAPINSPALINPTGNTPALFDSSLKLATTEFVQRALGNHAGAALASANSALTASIFGKVLLLNSGASFTVTLPPSAVGSTQTGSTILVQNVGSAAATLVPAAGDSLSVIATQPMSSLVIQPGTSVELVLQGTNYFISGGAALKFSPEFAMSGAPNGYQKHPSGLIDQWGSVAVTDNAEATVILPTAFPNAIFGAVVSVPLSAQAGAAEFSTAGVRKNGSSLNSILVNANSGPNLSVNPVIFWRVWGN